MERAFLNSLYFFLQYDFDDGDEEEGDDLPEDEETQEEGETDIEISVTDKVSTEERADSLQVAHVENAGDGKPKVQEERMETDENNDDELDAEMKEDQEAEEGNSWKENNHGEVVDKTEEKKRVEVSRNVADVVKSLYIQLAGVLMNRRAFSRI